MDDFPGLMADFGFRSQGKSAPMSAAKPSSGSGSAKPLSFDDIFSGFKDPNPNPSSTSTSSSASTSMPVYDKPVYDDDIFDGVPGMKSSTVYDDVFGSMSKGGRVDEPGTHDDLLGGLGREENSRGASKRSEDLGGFEELIPGFGGAIPPMTREPPDATQHNSAGLSAKHSAAMREDPFVVLEATSASAYPSSGMFTDPLENLGKPLNSRSANIDASGGIFDDIDAFDGLTKSVPSYASEKIIRKDKSPQKFGSNGIPERSSVESYDNVVPRTRPPMSFDSRGSFQSPKSNDSPYERNATLDQSPRSFDHLETADDVWLTVSEIPLFTQPTSAPPPSRPPPQLVVNSASVGRSEPRRVDNESYSQSTASYPYPRGSVQKTSASPFDELEDFAMGKPQYNEHAEFFSNEDYFETNSTAEASAAAMKEAMDRAEAKFRHAKEVRERERDARSARSREDERTLSDTEDLEDKERQEILERERLQREREEKEREQRRLEKEREELERGKARQAVDRATREARQRAATEARLRADRAAVEKVNAEARQRAERAAVQRAASEARERAAAEARERAERAAAEARDRAAAEARDKAAAEAREKAARDRAAEARDKASSEARDRAAVGRATAEARLRAERAAVDRVHAEARERAASEARERAAAAAREKQNKTEDDLESFFSMGARANSAPKQRATTTENIFDTQAQSRGSADGARRTSSTSSSTIRKASSATNIVDDLTSIFGGAQSSGDFQEVEGETEERRRARLERHQRTLERASKALAEKNERDMQTQRDQAERNRIAETLDMEIKRWASGKEGNLRALLSTLQYVLWPECGWQPVSLTDLITGAAVKKVYRKATLCIHPDKVQQKGATLQQKYIAEKVFDLLKEAWNKLNSEELF